ncbi:cobaltochelatase subunit CobN [Achromobacter denitrificans]|uniref:cobaltochelatase subunit CobN n=1 Tax=Achromobacter denitrificans TaxID=32002 RepID=UPI000B48A871|nr:cobaltochelatase subunit CobN [Achromobacter denitrificans]
MHRSAFPQGAARPRRLGRFARLAAACAGLLALALALAAPAQAAPGAATREAQARAHSRPRIAVISIELAQQPTLMRAAAARRADTLAIDLYGLGGGQLPGIEEADLSAYDLVVVEGVGPRLAHYRARLDAAARRTRVLVVNGDEWVSGNVPASAVPQALTYWRNGTVENYTRLLDYLGARLLGMPGLAEPPVEYPERAFYHPAHAGPFPDVEAYLAWARQRLPGAEARPRVGIVFYRSLALGDNAAVIDALVNETESQGGLPVPLWRSDSHDSLRHLRGADGKPAVDALILCASQIDYAAHRAGVEEARALGVAVLGCTTDYTRDAAQWRADPGGFAPDRSGQLALSEANGIIEPMMVGARRVRADGAVLHEPLAEQVSWRVARALAWTRLHRLPNAEKRLVISYHSEAADQADVGGDPDSYLDAQASLAALLRRLRGDGYDVGALPLPDADALAQRMARDGANVSAGLWGGPGHAGEADAQYRRAQAELARRLAAGDAVAIPEAQYLAWYRELPQALREAVEARWGPPPGRIMVHAGQDGQRSIVIPALRFGKVVVAPHPVWGYLQDAGALASTDALPPHHQYVAFYLWMTRGHHADAYVPLFTQLSLMPGKQQGPARDDWVGRLIGDLPHIQPTPLQANGGIGNKRRANALTLGFMPPLALASLPPDLAALRDKLDAAAQSTDDSARQAVRALAARHARALDLDAARAPWPQLEAALRRYLAEVEAAPMPVGGHVLGQPPDADVSARMVHAMLAGDMAEPPPLETVRAVIAGDARHAPADVAERIQDYAARVAAAPRESDAVLDALDGRYIEPGPMADAVRNPDALPPGRNPYTFATRSLPTREAWVTGSRMADALIENYRKEHGQAPRKVAFVLWSVESTQNRGAMEAQILRLMGARPVWNPRGEVIDVALDDRAALGRPRVDVLVTTSGTYRDHFGDKIAMLAKAARLAAAADERDNAVRANSLAIAAQLAAAGAPAAEARARADRRIYSTAPGAYSPSTQFALQAGADWTDARLSRLYTDRLGHAYGEGGNGAPDAQGFVAQLSGVEAAVFSRSSNTYGLLDTSMPAAYLGGIGMAVREQTGAEVAHYVADLKDSRPGAGKLEPLARAFGRELQSRYFNPAWIRAMQDSGYNGARYMADLPAHMLLWDVTTPRLVSDADWSEAKAVYVDDKFQLGLDEYFARHNPHARQHLLETLIAAIDRGAWQADAADRRQLEEALAQSVARHGSDCALPRCQSQEANSVPAQHAPALAPPAAGPAGAAPPATQVQGYALEPRAPTPAQAAPDALWLWLLAVAGLVALGASRPARW